MIYKFKAVTFFLKGNILNIKYVNVLWFSRYRSFTTLNLFVKM